MNLNSNERTCYIHVGTHKTGTTAVQTLLHQSADRLAQADVFYPRSGIYLAGHHNLVFELMRDDRFSRDAGTWDDFCREVSATAPSRICISSEAFGYLAERKDDLAFIRDRIVSLGYHPVILLYVRPQADYAAALYGELANHGHAGTFESLLDDVCRTGAFVERYYGCEKTYTFAYASLAAAYAGVFGADSVRVRRYDLLRGKVIDDVLEVIGGDGLRDAFDEHEKSQRVNGRGSVSATARLFARNVRENGASEAAVRPLLDAIDALEQHGNTARFTPVLLNHQVRIARAFAAGNAALMQAWNVRLAPTTMSHFSTSLQLAADPRSAAASARCVLKALHHALGSASCSQASRTKPAS